MSSTATPPASQNSSTGKGIFRSTSVVSIMTMLSRIMGMLRDTTFAWLLGDSAQADAFYVAFRVPNFLRRLFAEGAFAQAFVPVLSEYRVKHPHETVKGLVDRVAGVLGLSVLVVTVPVVLFSPVFTALFALGFYYSDPAKFALTADMMRITFPYLILISLTGFAGAVLNTYDRFAVASFTPVILNITLIIAAVGFSHWFAQPVMALAWGVLVAGALQLAFQMPFLARVKMLPAPKVDFKHEGVRRIMVLMVPALFGVSVSQINLLLDTVIASFLPAGSVSWLYYSDRMMELPLGVIGIAVATVILPSLARDHVRANVAQFSAKIDWGLRMILLVSMPAMFALLILARPILATLFMYGTKFSENGLTMATISLQAYSLGLVAHMGVKVLAPGYYARQDIKTPVRIGIIAMVMNMVFNLLLVTPLHFFWRIGHVGLALATTLSAFLNSGLLLRGLLRENFYRATPGWGIFMAKVAAGTAVMSVILVFALWVTGDWQRWVWYLRVVCLTGICVVGFAGYFATLWLCGIRAAHFHLKDDEPTVAPDA